MLEIKEKLMKEIKDNLVLISVLIFYVLLGVLVSANYENKLEKMNTNSINASIARGKIDLNCEDVSASLISDTTYVDIEKDTAMIKKGVVSVSGCNKEITYKVECVNEGCNAYNNSVGIN